MPQGKFRRREWDEPEEPGNEPGRFDSLIEEFQDELRDFGRGFRRAAALEWLRFKARAVDAGVNGVLHFFIGAFFLAIFLSGGVFIALAIRDSLGNLVAGFAILGVVLVAGLIVRAIARRRNLRQARRVFDGDDFDDGRDDS